MAHKARVPSKLGFKAGQSRMKSNKKAAPSTAKAQTKRQSSTARGKRA